MSDDSITSVDPFDVTKMASNAVLYGVLVSFTLLSFAGAGYFSSFLSDKFVSRFLLKHRVDNEQCYNGNNDFAEADYFLSARNSAGPYAIALSYFASGMGAWVSFIHYMFAKAYYCFEVHERGFILDPKTISYF